MNHAQEIEQLSTVSVIFTTAILNMTRQSKDFAKGFGHIPQDDIIRLSNVSKSLQENPENPIIMIELAETYAKIMVDADFRSKVTGIIPEKYRGPITAKNFRTVNAPNMAALCVGPTHNAI